MAPQRGDFTLDVLFWNPRLENDEPLRAGLDSRAQPLIIRQSHVESMGYPIQPYTGRRQYVTLTNGDIPIVGEVTLCWCFVKGKRRLQDTWLVIENLVDDAIIGTVRWNEAIRYLPPHVLGTIDEAKQNGGPHELKFNQSSNTTDLRSLSPADSLQTRDLRLASPQAGPSLQTVRPGVAAAYTPPQPPSDWTWDPQYSRYYRYEDNQYGMLGLTFAFS
jgi:hypothetical protein